MHEGNKEVGGWVGGGEEKPITYIIEDNNGVKGPRRKEKSRRGKIGGVKICHISVIGKMMYLCISY